MAAFSHKAERFGPLNGGDDGMVRRCWRCPADRCGKSCETESLHTSYTPVSQLAKGVKNLQMTSTCSSRVVNRQVQSIKLGRSR